MDAKLNQIIYQQVGTPKTWTSRPPMPTDRRLQRIIQHVDEHGYVIIPDAFSNENIAEAKTEIDRLTYDLKSSIYGRNSFEGSKTRRIYALLNKSRVFDKFTLHEDVLALNDYFLDPGYLLHSYQSITLQPGEKQQQLHHDDGYITMPRPRKPCGTAIMIAIDDFTATNGATVVVPKSNHWGADDVPDQSQAIPAIMTSGSLVYFLGTLWHGGGANMSGADRMALTAQYSQPWVRQVENQVLAVELEKLQEIPSRLVGMLGYQIGAPFIGHVDGQNPMKTVRRLLKQREGRERSEQGNSKL